MDINFKAIKGTQDLLPGESHKIQFLESTMIEIADTFGFKEIRTPVFEETKLFQRSVGDTTDVVQKEMYTFEDKGNRSITLRPEGTAGIVRAYLEHGLFNEPLPQKFSYLTSCYRYEKPQAGRLREFHQFGVECIGTASPAADAEVISVANEIFGFFGIRNLDLQINSIGCPKCRPKYHEALKEYFKASQGELCKTCLDRLDRNPMRILDCKSPVCSSVSEKAPTMLDFVCDECSTHFESVKKYLEAMKIEYIINPKIVRGLDYYTKTVFEFVSNEIGAQGTVCGGGRYDGLVEEMGGNHTPSLGFAMGIERLMLLMQKQEIVFPDDRQCDIFVVSIGEAASLKAAEIVTDLRAGGVSAQFDVAGRSVKAQMKFAGKIGAKYSIVLGENEIETSKANLKNMETGETREVELISFADDFLNITVQEAAKNLGNYIGDGKDIDISKLLGGLD